MLLSLMRNSADLFDPNLLTTLQLHGLSVLVGPDLDTPSTPHS